MGLFSFMAEVVSAPIKVGASVTKATVRSVGHVVTMEPERIADEVESVVDDTAEAAKKAEDALDE